jgi:hypothetical protein
MNFTRQSVQSLFQAVKQRLRQWIKPDNHSLLLTASLVTPRSRKARSAKTRLLRRVLSGILCVDGKNGVGRQQNGWDFP